MNGIGDDRLASAQRLLGEPPRDLADFEARLLLFAEETLASHFAEEMRHRIEKGEAHPRELAMVR